MAKPGKAKSGPGYNRFQKLKKRYGLSADDYALLLARQKGVCAICGYAPSSTNKHLVVDHCHGTTKVRGLLCQWCNIGIGHLKDSPKLLRRAAIYLTKAVRSGILRDRLAMKVLLGRSKT
jgi:hypothetical protein